MKHKIGKLFPYYAWAFAFAFLLKHLVIGGPLKNSIAQDFVYGIWDLFMLTGIRIAGALSWVGGNWYITAMLLSMLVLYPLALRYKEAFALIIAPVILFLSVGHLSEFGHLAVTGWTGLIKEEMVRALGDMSLGCFSWVCAQKLKQVPFTNLGRAALAVGEFCILAGVLIEFSRRGRTSLDFILLLLLFVLVTSLLSEQSALAQCLKNKNLAWCGTFSLCIYLTHIPIADVVNYAVPLQPGLRLLIYLGLSLVMAGLQYVLVPYIKRGVQSLVPFIISKEPENA